MRHDEIVIDKQFKDLNPVQFGYESCEPLHSFGPSVRTHWLLHYVVSGYGKFTRNGITHKVGAGQIFVIPPYVETYYRADEADPWSYIWIGFTTTDIPECLLHPVLSNPNVGSVFHDMKECSNYENGKSAYLTSCLWKLVSILSEEDVNKSDYVDKALHYMQANYANHITIQEIADSLGLNRKYFCTLFSQKTGFTPIEYLGNYRLSKAAELMTIHKQSPTTAALSVGYADIYHFSKAFKKKFGLSPRNYCKCIDKSCTLTKTIL